MDIKKILLVEDNLSDVKLTLAAFTEARLANEVVVVRDGEEALDFLQRRGLYALRTTGNPAVVLLDLKLPKLDGLQVLEKMRADDGLRQVPVVMLTSSREEQDLVRSYALGVNAYVVKPVDYQEFLTAVKDLGTFWAIINNPPPGCVGHVH